MLRDGSPPHPDTALHSAQERVSVFSCRGSFLPLNFLSGPGR